MVKLKKKSLSRVGFGTHGRVIGNKNFFIFGLRENKILKTDTLDKVNICNRQFQSDFTHKSDAGIPSKGTSPFTPMGEITVDPNGVLKLLNKLKIHKASGPDCLSARVLKECSSEIAPILALIYNETLAQGTVPDDWRQANVAQIFKKGEKYDAANYTPGGCLPLSRGYKHVYNHYYQTSSLKPLGQSKPNFMLSLLGKEERKHINGTGHMAKMATMLIYGKNFQKSSPTELIVL